MSGALFFEIPEDPEIMVQLLEAVPPHWEWMSGGLYPPPELIAAGRVAEKTGIRLGRFYDIHPSFEGCSDKKPDLYAIIVEEKLPGFIHFSEVQPGNHETISQEFAKRIASGLLLKGYRGSLRFESSCYNDNYGENPHYCNMKFQPWNGDSHYGKEETGPQPPRIKVGWDSRYYGNEEGIAAIVEVCRSLNLREYIPTAPSEAAV